MARKTVKQIRAEAAEYALTVQSLDVRRIDLRVGMIVIRPSGARYRIDSLDQSDEQFTLVMDAWTRCGLPTEGAYCLRWTRIDTWGLPGAEYERESRMLITPSNVAHLPLQVEYESIIDVIESGDIKSEE